jgi:hypothetical protein
VPTTPGRTVEFLTFRAQPGHPILAEDGHRCVQEVQVQTPLRPGLLPHRKVRERLRHLLDLVARLDGLERPLIELVVLGIDDDVDVVDLTEFTQLERRELRLRGPPATEHVDVGDLRGLQALVHVVRDLRGVQVIGLLREHPSHVEGDIAVAEHGDLLRIERPGLGDIGMSVVPVDEVGGTVGTRQVDPGQRQRCVDEAAGGEDHRIVAVGELAEVDVGSVFDVAEQADVTAVEHLDEGIDDALDPRMVGGDSVADEPEGRGQAFEQVDAQFQVMFGFGQQVGGVDAGGTGTDDGHSEWE